MRLMQRLPRETGRDYALRVIKDNIIRLELAPGSFISENELASELGLSYKGVAAIYYRTIQKIKKYMKGE